MRTGIAVKDLPRSDEQPSISIEYLGPDECWRLIGSADVGRLGVLVDNAPEIYPVNHVIDDGMILFRTDDGTKLRGLDRSPSVCFQVDLISDVDETGWSVLVKGRAVELTSSEDVERATRRLPPHLWTVGTGSRYVRISADEISGRRIRTATRITPASLPRTSRSPARDCPGGRRMSPPQRVE